MNIRKAVFWLVSLVVVGVVSTPTAYAQSWDPLPPLAKGERLAMTSISVAPSLVEAKRCLKSFDSAVGAQYYAGVVDVTSRTGDRTPSDSNAVPFVDALYQHWHQHLDPDTHVLIALGISNRAIAIHPGHAWAKAGFERDEIKRTIDASPFASHARNGDYGRGLCELIASVDKRLKAFEDEAEERRKQLVASLNFEASRHEEISKEIGVVEDVYPAVHAELAQRLRGVERLIQQERELLEEHGGGDDEDSVLSTIRSRLNMVKSLVKELPEMPQAIDDARDRISTVRSDMKKSAWGDSHYAEDVVWVLDSCERHLVKIEDQLASGTPRTKEPIEDCVQEIDTSVERARDSYFLAYRVIPGLVVGFLVLLALAILIGLRVRRQRALAVATRDLEKWSSRLGKASVRLLDLEDEFPFYFNRRDERYVGETHSLDQACADAVNRVYLLFDEANSLGRRAETLIENASALKSSDLQEASSLLHDTPIRFETGEPTESYRIFLPLTEAYEGTATTLMEDLDEVYQLAVKRLRELDETIREADQKVSQVSEACDEIAEEVGERDRLGFPTKHLVGPMNRHLDTSAKANHVLASDPAQAISIVRGVFDDLKSLIEQAQSGNASIKAVRGDVASLIASIRARVDSKRAEGFALKEPGFEPDVRLSNARQQAQFVLDRVASGAEGEAAEVLVDLQRGLSELEQQVRDSVEARQGIPRRVEEFQEQIQKLREDVGPMQEILNGLHARHAIESFAREADNVVDLIAALNNSDALVEAIQSAHSAEHYLSALSDLSTLARTLERGARFVAEVHTVEEELEAAIQSARAARQSIEAKIPKLESHADPATLGIGTELKDDLHELRGDTQALMERFDRDCPNWLELDHDANELRTHIELALEECASQLESHAQAVRFYKGLEDPVSTLAARIWKSTDDRPHVEKAMKLLQEDYRRLGEVCAEPEWSGEFCLTEVRDVDDDLARVRTLFERDLELAAESRSALSKVRSQIKVVRNKSYGFGVSISMASTDRAFKDARRALQEKRYEEALEGVRDTRREMNKASQKAKASLNRARRASRARAAAASSSHSTWSSSSSSSSSFSSSSSSSSSWSSSSSSGSSFGSSSSGGSSW